MFFINCSDRSSFQELKVEEESEIFQPNSLIEAKDFTIMIFGNEDCIYCKILKQDISKSNEIKNLLKERYNTYYISTDTIKEHKVVTETKEFAIVTEQLANLYKIRATPTTVICDKNFEPILILPGYLPSEMFLSSLEFIAEHKYTSRENIYKELQEYFSKKGLI
jgi:thioredoxin-related protein